jgi:hypothetical protein
VIDHRGLAGAAMTSDQERATFDIALTVPPQLALEMVRTRGANQDGVDRQ